MLKSKLSDTKLGIEVLVFYSQFNSDARN